LLHGEKVESEFIDFALGGVDESLALEHGVATRQITINVGLAGAIYGLLGQPAHAEQTCPKFIESLVKAATHSSNLPLSKLGHPT
jgi:hypothetical protein